MSGDGASERREEKTKFWAAATPLLAALQPPRALGPPGPYRPRVLAELLAPSPAALTGQHQREDDSTRSEFEALPCSAVSAGDGDGSVLQDALADDCYARSTDLERIFPSIDRPSRSLDVRGTEGFLSCDAVHHTLHRLFILALRALHLSLATKTTSKAAAFATLSCSGISESAQRRHRRDSQSTPSRSRTESQLAHYPGSRAVSRHDDDWCHSQWKT